MIRIPKNLIPLTIENHSHCPKCGSGDTEIVTVKITDYIHRSQGYPRCNYCYYVGMMSHDKIYWGCSEHKGKIVFNREDVDKIDDISTKSLPFDSNKIVDEMINEEIEKTTKIKTGTEEFHDDMQEIYKEIASNEKIENNSKI